MKLSKLSFIAAALICLASARFDIDAVFYGEFYGIFYPCDVLGVACTNLPENTCCAASKTGTRDFHDGLFSHNASQVEGSINGTFYSRQGDNDCGIARYQTDYGICLGADLLTGGTYTINSPKPVYKAAGPPGIRHPDSWYYRSNSKAYYIRFTSTKKDRALQKFIKLKNFLLLEELITKNYDFVKPAESGHA